MIGFSLQNILMTDRSAGSHLAAPLFCILLLGTLLVGGAEEAQAQRIAYAPRVSTLGIGGDFTVGLSSTVNLRAGASYLTFHHDGTLKDDVEVQYEVNGRLSAALLLLDWHPFANAFRLSAGAVYNGTRATGHAQPTESYSTNQKTFQPDRLGSIDAEVSFSNKINPYLGVGVGNAVRGSRLDFFADLGAMYVAQPEVQMTGTGLISATTNHEETLNQGFRSFRLLPYLAFGLSIHI